MLQDIQVFVVTFYSIVWEALPFIVLGAVIAGILEELLPQQLISQIMPKYAIPAVMIGGLLGLVFPMCECGIVVVMRRLLRKGLPLACCVSYMLAGPIVNVVVLFSTYVAFGGLGDATDPARDAVLKQTAMEMTLLRAGIGFVVACVAGLVVHLLQKRTGPDALLTEFARPRPPKRGISLGLVQTPEDAPAEKKTLLKRLDNISSTALHDFMDITVFLILGAVLAAFAKLFIGDDTISALSREEPYLAIPAMMGLAVLLCLCSEADAFVAASFTELAASSKLAFLVLGPMLDLKLLLMYTRVFRPKLIATIVTCTVLQTFAYMMIVHAMYDAKPKESVSASVLPAPIPDVAPTTAK
ncbi:MAG: permease [Fimbriiglobus sp.]